ncbi:hypothetical protein D3C81_1470030 [compost metagenome]
MQDGIGRAVGVVAHVIRRGTGELVLRVEAGHLQDALQIQRFHGGIGVFQEVVVLQEIGQHFRVDDQRGVDLLGRGVAQQHQFFDQLFQQGLGRAGVAEHEAHLLL